MVDRFRRSVGVLVLVLLVTTLGCGTSSAPRTTATTVGGAESAAVESERKGGIWREALTEPNTLDPATAYEGGAINVVKALFVGLTTFDDNPDLAMRPGVAERWSANGDCTEWTFSLRRSTFSNGEPVTAESFIRGMTRVADGRTASRVASHLSLIEGYDALHGTATSPPTATTFSGLSAPDPQTLLVRLTRPDCEFDKKTLHWAYSPVPAAAGSGDNRAFGEAPVGNGPFMIKPGTKWEHDRGLSLVRNDSYFGPKPHLDGIEFVILATQAPPGVAYQSFQSGELDGVVLPGGNQRKAAEAAYGPGGGFVRRPTHSVAFAAPNTARGPMASPEARRAVSLAIDRQGFNQAVGEGYNLVADSFTPPVFGSYHQPGACESCRFDPVRARELASGAGLTPGTKIVLLGSQPPPTQIWKQQLETNLGLEVEVVGGPEGAARRQRGDFDLALGSYLADYPTVDALLYPVFGSDSKENRTGYRSAEFDALVAQARGVNSDAERRRLYQAAERVALRDQAVIPTSFPVTAVVFDPDKWAGVDFRFGHGLRYEAIHLK